MSILKVGQIQKGRYQRNTQGTHNPDINIQIPLSAWAEGCSLPNQQSSSHDSQKQVKHKIQQENLWKHTLSPQWWQHTVRVKTLTNIFDISRSNVTRYWTKYERKKAKSLFRLWTHKRRPIACPWGRAMWRLSRVFGEKSPRDIESAL